MASIITIVIPWFGPESSGGAEAQARQLARSIHAQGAAVEVWSTTGRDAFAPLELHYPPGKSVLDGIPVRRFPPTPPRAEPYIPPVFANHTIAIPEEWQHIPEHEQRLLASLVSSDDLLEAVFAEREQRRFIFMPYPFPTTFWGIMLAGNHGYLLPCLHDEPYARYTSYRVMFRRAIRILANSSAERDFALRLYDLLPAQVVVAGEGIDLAPRGDRAAFRAMRGLEGPLLLFTGARTGKNVPLLIAYTREYWARRGGKLTLMISGREVPEIPPALTELVLDLGYLSVQEKHDAYAAADIFINPSTIESFSIGLMEAWLQGTPALVTAHCAVTREATEASAGGLAFADFGEFAAALDLLLGDPALRATLGARGQAWVQEHCRWEDVAQRTIAALE